MVERITDPHRPVSLRHSIGRIPDGRPGPHGVPQPPPAAQPPPVTGRQYLTGGAIAVIVLTLLVIGVFW